MNIKEFLTLAMAVNLFYGLWYFVSPQGAANVYGFGGMTTPLSNVMLHFVTVLLPGHQNRRG